MGPLSVQDVEDHDTTGVDRRRREMSVSSSWSAAMVVLLISRPSPLVLILKRTQSPSWLLVRYKFYGRI